MSEFTLAECRASMTCGGPVKVIASIEDPADIQKILDHLKQKGETQDAVRLPDARGPPQGRLFE